MDFCFPRLIYLKCLIKSCPPYSFAIVIFLSFFFFAKKGAFISSNEGIPIFLSEEQTLLERSSIVLSYYRARCYECLKTFFLIISFTHRCLAFPCFYHRGILRARYPFSYYLLEVIPLTLSSQPLSSFEAGGREK